MTGRVRFALEVGTDGRVSSCRIIESTGVPDLDRVACQKVTERGRFTPARNQSGEPVPGVWTGAVQWKIVDDLGPVTELPAPGYFVASLIVEADGTVSSCEVERSEGEAERMLGSVCDETGPFTPPLDENGNPERRRIRIMMRVAHEPLP